MVIDHLHCLFLGVTLALMKFWFNKKHSKNSYNIRQKVTTIFYINNPCILSLDSFCDKRLLAIRVPDFISRPPRSISESEHWKGIYSNLLIMSSFNVGSELRAWLFYYSVPVLFGVFPHPYFVHYCYLVAALHILHSSRITMDSIDNAERYLHLFYTQCHELYGRLIL